MYHTCDVGIVGGGLAGTSLAAGLAHTGASVTLIEAVPARSSASAARDSRGLALSLASVRILAALDAWAELEPLANPIRRIHVSDRGRFGSVHLNAGDLGLDALGFVVAGSDIARALSGVAGAAPGFAGMCPARVNAVRPAGDAVHLDILKEGAVDHLACRLLIVADGSDSMARSQLGIEVRRRDYGQTAIVANVRPARAHNDAAYERFTATGPLALLPLRDGRCSSVMTVRSAEADAFMEMEPDSYLEALRARFGRRLGTFSELGERRAWPLIGHEARQRVLDRVALLGNAAHTLHPNGAQGFNLALRDAAALVELLGAALAAGRDPGERPLLDAWLAQRRPDQRRVAGFTDFIARVFSNDWPGVTLARNAGLLFMDMTPALKRGLMRRAAGISGRQPRAVRAAHP